MCTHLAVGVFGFAGMSCGIGVGGHTVVWVMAVHCSHACVTAKLVPHA